MVFVANTMVFVVRTMVWGTNTMVKKPETIFFVTRKMVFLVEKIFSSAKTLVSGIETLVCVMHTMVATTQTSVTASGHGSARIHTDDPCGSVEIRVLIVFGKRRTPRLLVMSPHADDFYDFRIIQNLVDQPMLNVNAPGEGTCQVTDKRFEWRRRPVGIFFEDGEQLFNPGLEAGSCNLLRIALRMTRENDPPRHHFNTPAQRSTGVLSPFRIDALIPGMPLK
jgi:hypothetical protein